MTKEELRERILELEDRMSKEDSRKAISEMNDGGKNYQIIWGTFYMKS